ncbi:nitronate monooxygenase family protein [Clostridium sp. JN-9]|uniref:NAD(P)H-dependent flavin oxidoreductase n=1 Tax=Clostridium sp. JN-9 TaxID=2507159 RepID=UPI000FFE021E|nr:nitronate monooxygenase family protein [Clostridium sp. JN-9]QAT41517.1 nitronate monooxygenase [Clostridium sp. JN-9]
MNLPPLVIGDLIASVPIIQGGMGVGISGYKLASAVANEGAVGIISGAQIGYREPDFITNTKEANIRALRKEIRKAKEISPNGIIGVNLMVATNNYGEMVKACIEENADLIISGAGLPLLLPKFALGSNIKIAPIVSSGKAASIICKMWKRHNRCPDLIVVEGPEAGGHLGFHREDLNNPMSLDDIVTEVINEVKVFEEFYNKKIPVVAAGGVYDGRDIARLIKLGASGVQMATRFVATFECDADIKYKEEYIKCKKEDIEIIISPVGMPGRAIRNDFIKRVEQGRIPPDKCFQCLKKCNPKETPYCITRALVDAVNGNVDNALIFTGSNAYRIDKIVSVKNLIDELKNDAAKNLN